MTDKFKLPGSRSNRLLPVRELSLNESMEPREMLLTKNLGTTYPQTEIMQEQDVLPLGKLGVVTGMGGTGKTHLLTQLAISVATGEPWLDHFNVKNPGKVALLVGEENATEIKRRLLKAVNKRFATAQGSFLTKLVDNLHVMPLSGEDSRIIDDNGEETAFYQSLRTDLASRDLRLVIMDPAIHFMPRGAEDNAVVANLFARKLNALIRETGGPTLLMTHHNSYSEEHKERAQTGVRGLFDAARWIVNLELIPFHRQPGAVKLPWVMSHYPQFVAFRHVKSTYTKLLEYLILRRDDMGFLVFDSSAMEQIRNDYQGRH